MGWTSSARREPAARVSCTQGPAAGRRLGARHGARGSDVLYLPLGVQPPRPWPWDHEAGAWPPIITCGDRCDPCPLPVLSSVGREELFSSLEGDAASGEKTTCFREKMRSSGALGIFWGFV